MNGSTCPSATDVASSTQAARAEPGWVSSASTAAHARGLRRAHSRRIEALGRRLSDEVAWNILLDLVVSEDEGRSLSITALAVGAQAPLTTVLRYVDLLCDGGYAERVVDRRDRRRSLVRLTPKGRGVTDAVLVDRS